MINHHTASLIAHRGASAYAPENTLAAFELAYAFGCRFIEFDVMLSADQEAFVFHDEGLARTTNGKGNFGQAEANYLKRLDAGHWFSDRFVGEKIPTFVEALQWVGQSEAQANIEIKPYPGTMKETTLAVLSAIHQYWPIEKDLPLVSSFDVEALTFYRSLAPEMPIGYLMHEWDPLWLRTAEVLSCTSIHLNKRLITASRVREMKDRGYLVYAYTVNNPRYATKLLRLGVDAVFTDYPDLLSYKAA